MTRLRTFFRTPYGVRPLAAGLALAAAAPVSAAPSAAETLEIAVARELAEAADDAVIRPVAGTSDPGTPRPLPVGGEPKPIAGRFERMRELEAAYERDLATPNGPAHTAGHETSGRDRSGSATSPIRQVSSPPAGSTSPAAAKKTGNRFTSFFSRSSPSAASKSKSPARRSSRPSSTSTVSGGGMFGRMLKPFRGEDETPATPEQPPVPPPLKYADLPAGSAKSRSSRPSFEAPAPPAPSASLAGPAAPPPASLPEPNTENPFAEVTDGPSRIQINPANLHPLEDAFADVRGEDAPDTSEIADLDPEFASPVVIRDPGAPRPLDPELFTATDDFAPVRIAVPMEEEVQPPAPQQSAAARLAELQRKLAERSGLGGFQGFCPVALRDRRELIDARPEFLSVYQNKTYELSSAEAKARFEAAPTRYAPVNGGNDVILTARGEIEAEGSLTHAVWFKDRLYIFRTAETMREFNEEPTKYAVSE